MYWKTVNAETNKRSKCTEYLLSAQPPKVHLSPLPQGSEKIREKKKGGKLRKESKVRKDQSKTTSSAHKRMIHS